MLRNAIFFMAFLATLTLGIESPIPGYAVVPLTWEVDPFSNGTIVDITGTIETVYSQLIKINPHFKLRPDTTNTTVELGVAGKKSSAPTCGPFVHQCGPGPYNWNVADGVRIKQGISYLRGVSGSNPKSGPGFGACARVSCSYRSAIWWCNDNDHDITLDSFGTIADCAQGLLDHCSVSENTCLGQNFNTDSWNCIVRGDAC